MLFQTLHLKFSHSKFLFWTENLSNYFLTYISICIICTRIWNVKIGKMTLHSEWWLPQKQFFCEMFMARKKDKQKRRKQRHNKKQHKQQSQWVKQRHRIKPYQVEEWKSKWYFFFIYAHVTKLQQHTPNRHMWILKLLLGLISHLEDSIKEWMK